MMIRRCALTLLGCCASWAVWADDTVDAAIGGGVGGAVGAAVGQEVGDRKGAIIGGAVGGAIGAAIATDDDHHHHAPESRHVHVELEGGGADSGHSKGRFCPPGQAKKGRC